MTDWNDGYVSDISYVGGIYREQTPAHLDAACLVVGVAPPVPQGAPYTYCELGCGLGDTAIAVAAGNPHARVWAFDYNPKHVALGRAVVERTGLANVELAERSFEELATSRPDDLPLFDYVVLHGVWSWISPANQAHIVTFLRRHLRIGGLVCVSYNAMPGWAGRVGLQKLLYEAGRAAGGSSDHRIREALSILRRLADTGCGVIDDPALRDLENHLQHGRSAYLSHEFLNVHWRPAFQSEVAGAMAGAKLTYAASANILDNFPQFCIRPEQIAVVASLPPELRQIAEDAYCGRAFRRDVYIRGSRLLSTHERAERIGAQRVALVIPPKAVSLKMYIPAGEATLDGDFYGPAFATLSRGEAKLADLRAVAGMVPAWEEMLGVLIGCRHTMVAPNAPDLEASRAVRQFNRTRLALYADEGQLAWLVGARIGSAIPIGLDDALVYEVVAAAEERDLPSKDRGEATAAVRTLMAERGMALRFDGPDGSPDLEERVCEIMADGIPIWRAIGAL